MPRPVQPTLFDDPDEGEASEPEHFTLWFRAAGRRRVWRSLGDFASEAAAFAAIDCSGDWLVLPAGRPPTTPAAC